MIEEFKDKHLDEIVSIHLKTFPGDFQAVLGHKFLKIIYRNFINSDLGFGYIFSTRDIIKGFVVASFDKSTLFKKTLFRNFHYIMLILLWQTIRNPIRIFLRIFLPFGRYCFRSEKKTCVPIKEELVTIAVRKEFQRQGIGKLLVQAVANRFNNHGVSRFKVITPEKDEKSNKFYKQFNHQMKRIPRLNVYMLNF